MDFTHGELRCLLDAVSQYVENEDHEDGETKVPGHPAAHSARAKLEAYFATFAELAPLVLARAVVRSPRHPLDGAAVGLVRRDPFGRFVIVRVLEDLGDYSVGDDVRLKPEQVGS